MSKPLVSAIIATYNRADTVCKAIESILGQTYDNIEVVVVDDGSTDDTESALRPFGSRLHIIRQPNAGPAVARNRGIAAARGEIISFLDSDDIWLPQKIERQVRLLQRAGKSVPCCICNATLQFTSRPVTTSFQNALLESTEEEGLWLNVTETLLNRFVLFNQTVAIRREALEKAGTFDETLKYLEDYDLPLRLSLLGPWAFIREPLVVWYQGSSGSWSEKAIQQLVCMKECEVRLREKVLEYAKRGDENLKSLRRMRGALRKARRELWVAGLGQKETLGAHAVSHLLQRIEHYGGAIARRLPWYPKMKTASIANQAASSAELCEELEFPGIAR